MDLGLTAARVVITGGASNIGRGIVHAFAREGACVLLVDIDEEQAWRVRDEALALGADDVRVLAVDLATDGAGGAVARAAVDHWGGIDVLVNNAGWYLPGGLVEHIDRTSWQRTVEVNLFSAIDCTQAALSPMRGAGHGSIVYIADEAAVRAAHQALQRATEAGVIALARTTAREQGRHGIRANVVCPGLVLPAADAAGDHSVWSSGADAVVDGDTVERIRRATPLGRLSSAEDVAHAVVWLASEATARQVTGQILDVGGGAAMP